MVTEVAAVLAEINENGKSPHAAHVNVQLKGAISTVDLLVK
jgi:hypothetical protein